MSFLGLLSLCLFDNNHRHGRDMDTQRRPEAPLPLSSNQMQQLAQLEMSS
jgi:hypothetical protein